jgi:hypothetical protein
VGAASVTFQNQRNARVAFVTAIGGKGLADREVPLSSSNCCAEAALPVWRERVEIPSSGSGRGWA